MLAREVKMTLRFCKQRTELGVSAGSGVSGLHEFLLSGNDELVRVIAKSGRRKFWERTD